MAHIELDSNIIDDPKFAITPSEHNKGLMWVEEPTAMVFLFNSTKNRKFWMKNTPLSLDIIFCLNGTVVDIVTGKPFSEDLIGPEKEIKSDIVIEVPAGYCKKHNIDKGSTVKIKYDKKLRERILDRENANHQ